MTLKKSKFRALTPVEGIFCAEIAKHKYFNTHTIRLALDLEDRFINLLTALNRAGYIKKYSRWCWEVINPEEIKSLRTVERITNRGNTISYHWDEIFSKIEIEE